MNLRTLLIWGVITLVLVVLFIPSVERDGTTAIDQQHWVDAALAKGCCKTLFLWLGPFRMGVSWRKRALPLLWSCRRGRQPYRPPKVSRTHRVVLGDPTTADPHRLPSRTRDGEWTIHVHRREFE